MTSRAGFSWNSQVPWSEWLDLVGWAEPPLFTTLLGSSPTVGVGAPCVRGAHPSLHCQALSTHPTNGCPSVTPQTWGHMPWLMLATLWTVDRGRGPHRPWAGNSRALRASRFADLCVLDCLSCLPLVELISPSQWVLSIGLYTQLSCLPLK